MKCLTTYVEDGIVMDHIIYVEADSLLRAASKYDKLMKMIRKKDTELVVVAKDINGNTFLLGEYTKIETVKGLVLEIMEWASDPEDTKPFRMPYYDGDK